MEVFDINKYLGLWYEIMRYPTWFMSNSCYNTTATYILNDDGSINVINSTINISGNNIVQHGTANIIDNAIFNDGIKPSATLNVSFMNDQIAEEPNYIIDNVFSNKEGDYVYAVISNKSRDTLFVLSRVPTHNIRLETMLTLTEYIDHKYDSSKIIHTPHYMI